MNNPASSPAGRMSPPTPQGYSGPLSPSPDCARNPATPPHYLRFLKQFPELHADLALNPALPPDLEQWVKGHPDPVVQANLQARTRRLVAPARAARPLKPAGVPRAAATATASAEENFDATTLAGAILPATRPLPSNKSIPPQVNAPFPSAIAPAASGNLPLMRSRQDFPRSRYPQGMPTVAYPQSFPPAGSPGYPPVPEQYPPPRRKRRWLIPLIATIAVLAVIGGGIGAYFAFAGFRHVGYGSPEELAEALKASLDDSDLIGIAQMSAPSEDVFFEDALQLNKDLQKYISTADSKSKGGSGQLVDKVSDLTSVMQNLDIDTSGLSSKIDTLSDDISRINYSGRIEVKIKDRNKLKASLDKLIYDNKNAPEKEKKLKQDLKRFKELENEGIDIKSRDSLRVMAVKEEGKWYYSAPMSFLDNEINKPYNRFFGDPNYGANWANLTKTSSDSDKFAKELSGALSQVSRADDLFSEDCMRFLGVPERRIIMVYGPLADRTIKVNLKTKISTGEKTKYGHGYNLDRLTMEADGGNRWARLDVIGGTLTSENKYSKAIFSFSKYIQSDKFQLVAKDSDQGLKLSFSGSLANLFSNLDYDLGYEYFQEKNDDFIKIYEEFIEADPFQRPYKKVILGFYGLGEKMGAETEREDYNYDSDYDSDSDYDYDDSDYDYDDYDEYDS